MLEINKPAPDFTLPDQDNNLHSLTQYKGQWVVVYFYPKDDTPGCTTEACSFRDDFTELKANNIQVLGISKDSVKSHKKFADKFQLNFPLLSDPDKTVIQAYDSWGKKKFMGREFEGTLRNTYLINPKGVLVKIFERVTPKNHAKEIVTTISQITANQ